VSITGVSAATGMSLTVDSFTGGVALGVGNALFDAGQFADGMLSVSVNGGMVTGTLGKDTVAPENWWYPTQVAAGGMTQFDAGFQFWDPSTGTGLPMATTVVNSTANLGWSMLGSLVTVTPTAGASGYGWLTFAGMDAAGNVNTVDAQVAIFNPANVVDTSLVPNQVTTVTGTADVRFSDMMGTSNDVFLVGQTRMPSSMPAAGTTRSCCQMPR